METRTAEVRARDGLLIGQAIAYRTPAYIRSIERSEQFEPGAFQPLGTALLNVEHDRTKPPLAWTGGGGLELKDTDDGLTIRALPQGEAGRLAYDAVADGTYKGLSIEFMPLAERTEPANNRRIIDKSILHGIALTSSPAHNTTIEARQGGLQLAGTLPHGPNSRIVVADSGRVRKAEFGRASWEYSINDKLGKLAEISLTLNRDITRQIASRRLGTLTLRNGKSGLHFEANLAARGENQLHDELRESIESRTTNWQIYPVIQVPPRSRVSQPFIEIPEGPDNPGVFVRKFINVSLRQLSLVPKSGAEKSKVNLL